MEMTRDQWIQVAAIAVLFFCAVAWLATPLLPKSETTAMKVVELVIAASASIGTAVAAVVALYFGLASQRAQAAQAEAIGNLVAARVAVDLVPIHAQIEAYVQGPLQRDTLQEQYEAVREFFDRCDACRVQVSDEDLIRLVALDPVIAHRLSYFLAFFKRLRDEWTEQEWWDEWQASAYILHSRLRRCLWLLQTIDDALTKAGLEPIYAFKAEPKEYGF